MSVIVADSIHYSGKTVVVAERSYFALAYSDLGSIDLREPLNTHSNPGLLGLAIAAVALVLDSTENRKRVGQNGLVKQVGRNGLVVLHLLSLIHI